MIPPWWTQTVGGVVTRLDGVTVAPVPGSYRQGVRITGLTQAVRLAFHAPLDAAAVDVEPGDVEAVCSDIDRKVPYVSSVPRWSDVGTEDEWEICSQASFDFSSPGPGWEPYAVGPGGHHYWRRKI